MKIVELEIPLSIIFTPTRPMIPQQEVEYNLLELIKYNNYGDDTTVKNITNVILNNVYKTEGVKYPFKEIESFFNFKHYINVLNDKIDTVNMYLLNKLDNPFIKDYYFDRWNEDKTKAIYKIEVLGVEDANN